MDYFSILFHKKFGDSVPLDGKYYEALFAASSGGGWSETTLTGTSPLTFKGLGQPLKDYHIFGETVQDGTPSPDYPVDVQGVGEETKNLLDMTSQNIIDGYSLNRYGSEVSDSFFCVTDFLEVEPNTFYTVNITNRGGGIHYSCFYGENKNFISSYRASGTSIEEKYTYLSPNNAKYIRCSLMSITRYPQYVASYMLTNTETIPPEYIPYGSKIYRIPVTIGNVTTPIYIGADPLYRIGDFADEIDFANQRIIRRVDPSTMQLYATPITSTITVPQLTAVLGDNTLSVDTTVKPSAVSITGGIKPTGYGQMLDVNDVDIQDSNGTPIFIQG